MRNDQELERLLDLDGFRAEIGGGYWVKFDVRRVATEARAPHGVVYSLTLHDISSRRVFGIDNAHAVRISRGPAGRSSTALDHLHRGETVQPYVFRGPDTLLDDFWREVGAFLRETSIE